MCLYVWLMSYSDDIHDGRSLDTDRNQKLAFEKSIPRVIRIVLEVFPEEYRPLISWNNVKAVSQFIFNPVKRPSRNVHVSSRIWEGLKSYSGSDQSRPVGQRRRPVVSWLKPRSILMLRARGGISG